MATITRKALRSAIEAGIASCPDMTEAQQIALRHIGATATKVARGQFNYYGCGCPLTQAGIAYYTPDDEFVLPANAADFAYGYDEATRSPTAGWRINSSVRLLEVTG